MSDSRNSFVQFTVNITQVTGHETQATGLIYTLKEHGLLWSQPSSRDVCEIRTALRL
jgi:hypothetical protein